MISINQCRKILGKEYNHLKDEDIELLRNNLYQIAKITIEINKTKKKKEPISIELSKQT